MQTWSVHVTKFCSSLLVGECQAEGSRDAWEGLCFCDAFSCPVTSSSQTLPSDVEEESMHKDPGVEWQRHVLQPDPPSLTSSSLAVEMVHYSLA